MTVQEDMIKCIRARGDVFTIPQIVGDYIRMTGCNPYKGPHLRAKFNHYILGYERYGLAQRMGKNEKNINLWRVDCDRIPA